MSFLTGFDEQLIALKSKIPERDFDSLSLNNPDAVKREYEKIFVRPELLSLINKKVCKAGKPDAEKFELACLKIIRWTIGQEFSFEPVHHPPSMKLDGFKRSIRDITLPVPQIKLPSVQWESIKKEHALKSIVFECKNYGSAHKFKNHEIYQLFEYINPDQHGRLGVILARYGRKHLSTEANSAINRIAKDRYRILILGINDLITMIDDYIETGSCGSFFLSQVESARSDPI